MKRKLLSVLSLLLCGVLSVTASYSSTRAGDPGKSVAGKTDTAKAASPSCALQPKDGQDGAPVIFWTANSHYGPIEIFVDNVYQGDITRYYSSTPQCASPGCVTVIIKGDHNVWRAQTKDGKTKWDSRQATLADRVCNSERLN